MTLTFAYITDLHVDETYLAEIGVNPRENWKRLLDDVRAKGIRSIIFGGDIGEATANAWFFDTLNEFDLRLTLGNHDTFAEARQHYQLPAWKGKAEGYSAEENPYFKFVFLDSSSNAITVTQRLWLEQEMATGKPVLLFIHHPIFPVDTAVDRTYPLQGRELLQEVLQHRPTPTTIFCGHYHLQDEQRNGLIQQYITPAASYQMRKEAATIETDPTWFGYRIITLDKGTFTTEVVMLQQAG